MTVAGWDNQSTAMGKTLDARWGIKTINTSLGSRWNRMILSDGHGEGNEMKRAVALGVAALAFVGWIVWLAYAAWTKERGPILSRSRIAVATHAVVAEVPADEASPSQPSSRVQVRQLLTDSGPPSGSVIEITNMPRARGWQGAGEYLLLLTPSEASSETVFPPRFQLTILPRSPGYDSADPLPVIYPWTPSIRRQWEQRDRW